MDTFEDFRIMFMKIDLEYKLTIYIEGLFTQEIIWQSCEKSTILRDFSGKRSDYIFFYVSHSKND